MNTGTQKRIAIAFTKTRLPFGWLGNMAPFPIDYGGKSWKTAEHAFQALHFEDQAIQEQIRAESSPMWAKIIARRNQAKMAIVQRGAQDIANMKTVLRLKVHSIMSYGRGFWARPTARRIIDLFEPVQRHVLETTASSTPVVTQTAVTQRTGVHNQVLRLLRLPKNAYGG
jgi:hypothetical protein